MWTGLVSKDSFLGGSQEGDRLSFFSFANTRKCEVRLVDEWIGLQSHAQLDSILEGLFVLAKLDLLQGARIRRSVSAAVLRAVRRASDALKPQLRSR